MADKTHIAWTDSTWSPLLGCSPESSACTFCYARRDVWRMAHNPNPKVAGPRQGLVEKTAAGVLRWTGKVQLLPDQLDVPLHWKKPRRIFVANQADLFHPDVPDEFILRVFEVIREAHWLGHTFQVLTKRPARMADFCRRLRFDAGRLHPLRRGGLWLVGGPEVGEVERSPDLDRLIAGYGFSMVMHHLWLGTTVEDQRTADERIPELLATPAALRFLSCEPLLGPVDLDPMFAAWASEVAVRAVAREPMRPLPPRIGWVIVGGESGPGARPCDVAWIRSLVEQCRAAGLLPTFVKQLGSHWAHQPRTHEAYFLGSASAKGAAPEDWPEDLRVQEFPEVRATK